MSVGSIFLSYNTKDLYFVTELSKMLEREGVPAWYADAYLLQGSSEWPAQLEEQLQKCSRLFALYGQWGLGKWQTREILGFMDRRIGEHNNDNGAVVGVLLPGFTGSIPAILGAVPYIDFRNGLDNELETRKLIAAAAGKSVRDTVLRSRSSALCPYPGSRPFGLADAPFFIGREQTTRELVDMLRSNLGHGMRWVCITGSSGVGKTSLAQAGLLSAIQKDAVPGISTWRLAICTPGAQPMNRLAESLSTALGTPEPTWSSNDCALAEWTQGVVPANSCIVVLVDQLEDLIRYKVDQRQREQFVRCLVRAAASATSRVAVIITVRQDMLEACETLPELKNANSNRTKVLDPLTLLEMRQAITLPARMAGRDIDLALVERLITDNEGSCCLSLVQDMLVDLWKEPQDERLTLARYDELGGIRTLLAKCADRVINGLSHPERTLLRHILEQLVLVSPNDAEPTMRHRESLRPANVTQDAFDSLLYMVTHGGSPLIRISGDNVQVSHRCLIQSWPQLAAWIEESRHTLMFLQRLNACISDYEAHRQARTYLLSGGALKEARTFLKVRPGAFNREQLAYVNRSSRFESTRYALVTLIMLAVFAGAGYFLWRRSIESKEREIERLAASEQFREAVDRALNLPENNDKARWYFHEAIQSSHAGLKAHGLNVTVSADLAGKTLLSWDASSVALTTPMNLVFGKAVRMQPAGSYPFSSVERVALSPDGSMVAYTKAEDRRLVRLYVAKSQSVDAPTQHWDLPSAPVLIGFSKANDVYVVHDREVRFVNSTRRIDITLSGSISGATQSASGDLIAIGSGAKVEVASLTGANGKKVIYLDSHIMSSLQEISLSPNGHYLALAAIASTAPDLTSTATDATSIATEPAYRCLIIQTSDGHRVATWDVAEAVSFLTFVDDNRVAVATRNQINVRTISGDRVTRDVSLPVSKKWHPNSAASFLGATVLAVGTTKGSVIFYPLCTEDLRKAARAVVGADRTFTLARSGCPGR
jgi:hypothetical protein